MASTPRNPEVPRFVANRILLLPFLVRPVPVQDPLFDIAMDIEEAPGVWRCLSNHQRHHVDLWLSKGGSTLILMELLRKTQSGKIRFLGSCPGCIFPLSLSRQSIGQALFFRKTLTEFPGLCPAHKNDSFIVL